MNKLQKIIATYVLAVMMLVSVPAAGALLSGLYSFATGTDILAGEMNHNFNATTASMNYIENPQLAPNSVTTSKITDGTILSADMNCAAGNYWDLITACGGVDNADSQHTHSLSGVIGGSITAAQHGDLSGTTSTMHTGESVTIVDSGAKYATDTVEAALQEIATYTGLGGGATGGMSRIGSDYDATTYSNCSVEIPPDAGSNGIRVYFQLDIIGAGGGAPAEVYVPLKINSTTLSIFGALNSRFHLLHNDQSPAPGYQNEVGFSEINGTNYPALDMTATNTIYFGMPFRNDTGADWSANGKNYKMMVDVF